MTDSPPPPLEKLVNAIVEVGGPLTSIVSHMVRFEAAVESAPDAPSIPVALANILRGTLDPLRDEFSAEDLEMAAAVLSRACAQVVDDVLLVEPDA
jgi:hypothetical protein